MSIRLRAYAPGVGEVPLTVTERHVWPDPRGGWYVSANKGKVSSRHETDVQAIAWVKTALRQRGAPGRVVVHDGAGRTRTEQV